MNNIEIISEISKEYCIGCGICSITNVGKIQVDGYGKYKVDIENLGETAVAEALSICPFSSTIQNEDEISKEIFKTQVMNKSENIGYFYNCYAGFTNNLELRMNSSSGGILTWLNLKLLESNLVDYIVHVVESDEKNVFFKYKVCSNRNDVISGSSSKYYPVELSSILDFILNNPGSYAIVALPCFTKGLRLLQKINDVFKERIKYILSPICGHLKTMNYSYFLAWQAGIEPRNLISINFRKKLNNRKANQYGTEFHFLELETIKRKLVPNSYFKMGTNWGHGMFKYPACDYCDDIVGELGDVSIGDAWLPEYTNDDKGTSIIIVRNPILNKILNDGVKDGEINVKEISYNAVEKSQEGGIRNKRSDLSYRLWLAKRRNLYYPHKRISPSNINISTSRKLIIKMRIAISKKSHQLFIEALQKQNIDLFYTGMKTKLRLYGIIESGLKKSLKRILRNFKK